MWLNNLRRTFYGVILLCLVITACTPQMASKAWIDVPLDGLVFNELQMVNIQGHASSRVNISQVEILVNDSLLATVDSLQMKGDLGRFQAYWFPTEPGTYTIQAIAYAEDGLSSLPHTVMIHFLSTDELALRLPTHTPTPTRTPTLTATPTKTPTVTIVPSITLTQIPEPEVRFWASPTQIQADSCTTIYWQAKNVSTLIFGGTTQPFEGSFDACLCGDARYTLTINHLDGSQELRTVHVSVTGNCTTPIDPDTTPPPIPQPFVPAHNLTLSCRATQDLVWVPVDDPSGIAEYQVQVQRHSGNNLWRDITGSMFTDLVGKETTIPVGCGWYYRWRVRAVDGAGNSSEWSDWFMFTITIG